MRRPQSQEKYPHERHPRHADDTAILSAFAQQRRQGLTRRSALHQALLQLIAAGELPWRTKLPPSRVLAARLAVARDTVEQTYARLEAEGFISRTVGRGSFVRYRCDTLLGRELLATATGQEARLAERELSDRGRALLAVRHTPHTSRQASLTPSLADLRAFPIDQWLQREKQVLRQHGERLLGYADPQGLPELRAEIAHYLQRERGVKATAEQVIVVTSSQQALALCTQVLFDPGDAVFVEEPGYQGRKAGAVGGAAGAADRHRRAGAGCRAANAGLGRRTGRVYHAVPSLPAGVFAEPRSAAGTVAVGAAAASLDHRRRLRRRVQLRPANQGGAAGLDGGGRTLYLGTFSKTLFPGLRIGFMIAPPQLVRPLVAARQFQDGYTSALAQMTLFHFLHEGSYAEHLRNMRTLYKARLDALYDAVHRHLAAWTRPALPQGGLQLVCPLADAATERRLVVAAAERGIRLYGLADFYTGTPQRGALVLGFSAYTPDEIVRFITTLAQVFSALPVASDG